MERRLPSGRVTFAFTDVVGSTRTFIQHGQAYAQAVQAVQRRVASHATSHGGVVVSTEGDGAMLAFPRARQALEALCCLQEEVESVDDGLRLRLRAGAHTGDAEPIGDLYVALPVYVAARVSSTAGAGQVIVSQSVIDELDEPVGEELGAYALKDVADPVTLWRVRGDDAPPKAVPARRTNVADPHTSFVGRDREIALLHELLCSSQELVTVVGAGGVGKTRLVSEYALRHGEDLPAGVWLVELASLSDPAETVAAVAATLGLSGPASPAALVSELDRRGELVLVLDNCEHLLDAVAELVTSLRQSCPSLRVLCTSREPLDLDRERVVRLSPLATSTAARSLARETAAGPGEAELLFQSRAEAAGAVVPSTELPAVTELCQLLDGLPLALELAAARAPLMPIRSLLDGLKERDISLSRRGGEARQRSLDSVVSWSLRLLDPADCDALFALAVFPGRFTAEMAEVVLSAVPGVRRHAFADLARRSLLDLDGSEYRMLVGVAEVAERELDARPETRRAALDGLFRWAVTRSTAPLDVSMSPDQLRAMELATEWGLENQLPGRGRVVGRLARWTLEGTVAPATVAWAERVLVEPLSADPDQVRINAAALRLVRGLATSLSDDVHADRARTLVEVARSLGDPDVLRSATSEAAIMLDRAGLQAEAESLHQETVRLSEATDGSLGPALLDLGVSYHLVGKLDEAEQHYRSALEHVASDPLNRTTCLINIGEVMLDSGRFDEAASQLRAALEAARSGRPKAAAWALALLAEAEAGRGATDEAAALARQAEKDVLSLSGGDPSLQAVLDRMHKALKAQSL